MTLKCVGSGLVERLARSDISLKLKMLIGAHEDRGDYRFVVEAHRLAGCCTQDRKAGHNIVWLTAQESEHVQGVFPVLRFSERSSGADDDRIRAHNRRTWFDPVSIDHRHVSRFAPCPEARILTG